MAETYGIYSYASLPLLTYATLASGLRPGSRIRQKMDGEPLSELYILSMIFDRIGSIFWSGEGDPPKRLTDLFDGKMDETSGNSGKKIFSSPEEFEREWEGG
ncbi:MAG: hypothetical protein Q4B85_06680 [Lachnospiraceae bacterium]|nr:hypothetical protein [Lachnospiraceae bacterium]